MPVPDDVRFDYFPVFPSASHDRLVLPTTRNPAELLLAGLNISQDHPQCNDSNDSSVLGSQSEPFPAPITFLRLAKLTHYET